MSKYSEYIKKTKEQDEKWFFGDNIRHRSNKYFTFDHVLDDDTIIINTNNIIYMKGSPVLIVAQNKAIYLKDWQLRKMHNYDLLLNFYCVKLNRKYFKPYTFSFIFDDYIGMAEASFDDLKAIAGSQDDLMVAKGWMK